MFVWCWICPSDIWLTSAKSCFELPGRRMNEFWPVFDISHVICNSHFARVSSWYACYLSIKLTRNSVCFVWSASGDFRFFPSASCALAVTRMRFCFVPGVLPFWKPKLCEETDLTIDGCAVLNDAYTWVNLNYSPVFSWRFISNVIDEISLSADISCDYPQRVVHRRFVG